MITILKSPELKVSIKHKGAEMCSVKNNDGLEFVWQAEESVWPRHAPVLFPIVGKLKDNSFYHKQKKYDLGQHGFARDQDFIVKEKDDHSVTFELFSDQTLKEKYPFDFILQIKYTLNGSMLSTEYRVKNPTLDSNLHFGIGAHPGFRCPLEKCESFEDYYLEFEQESFIQTTLKDGLRIESNKILPLQEKKLFLSKNLFDNDALVFENHQINTLTLASSVSKHKITINCTNWPYFGVWSKKGCTDFICLEPWYGIADKHNSNQQLEDKEGIIKLAPGKEFTASFDTIFA